MAKPQPAIDVVRPGETPTEAPSEAPAGVTTEPRRRGFFPSVDITGWPLVPPTRLTIHRTSSRDEQTRQIICALDGKRFGQVLFGETLTCEIAPGFHTLRVHNTLIWKTLPFEAEPGGHVHFTVWNQALAGYLAMLVFLGSVPLGLGVSPGEPADVATVVR
jgi:hypothetical protein